MLARAASETIPNSLLNATTPLEIGEDPTSLAGQVERVESDKIVLSLSSIQVISSELVNELLRTQLRLRLRDRSLVLINVQPQVAEVLRAIRFERTIAFREATACLENGQQRNLVVHPSMSPEGFLEYFMQRFWVKSPRSQRTQIVSTGFKMEHRAASNTKHVGGMVQAVE